MSLPDGSPETDWDRVQLVVTAILELAVARGVPTEDAEKVYEAVMCRIASMPDAAYGALITCIRKIVADPNMN